MIRTRSLLLFSLFRDFLTPGPVEPAPPILYNYGFGFCIMLDIFSSKIRFSLSISVYRSVQNITKLVWVCLFLEFEFENGYMNGQLIFKLWKRETYIPWVPLFCRSSDHLCWVQKAGTNITLWLSTLRISVSSDECLFPTVSISCRGTWMGRVRAQDLSLISICN